MSSAGDDAVTTLQDAAERRAGLRIAVVPPVPALLPAYSSEVDPLPELREAVRAVVRDLLAEEPTRLVVLHDPPDPANVERGVPEPLGATVAQHLLDEVGYPGEVVWGQQPWPLPDVVDACVLVMANGSARRGEKAPGHLDERSFGFDEQVEAALRSGDGHALQALDARLGEELMAAGIGALQQVGQVLTRPADSDVRWAGDPGGVQYWVVLLTARNDPDDAVPRVGPDGRVT
ncbi:hypothetical protein [Nocardioides perillae]|uniref:Uncharacterized protein n=1 Tax=Nocardioides perillae TaxID=1119534 RepID=A0A7Y9RUD5_9ACTN|nr:hypothetical protein [Nocardioides perillae]NYG54773.1 hypothetical protein [Nocardioides perillae]